MNDEEIICTCMGVTVGAIKEAYENGAQSVADIQDATSAGTVCGACLDEIELLLNQLSTEK
ncbi:MAG: (2Fe-2S)-binding protein [Lachnospiraceae bacterium]